MKKKTTLIILIFCLGLIGWQKPLFAAPELPFVFDCSFDEPICFITEDQDLALGPADDLFGLGEDFELITKFSFEGPVSRVRFIGAFLPLPIKSSTPPAADFRVNIYESGENGPGELKASFRINDKEADDFIDITENDSGLSFLCLYDLELPGVVDINGEAYIGITRINNVQVTKDLENEFLFRIFGIYYESYEDSYIKNFLAGQIRKNDTSLSEQLPQFSSSASKDANNWEVIPFMPQMDFYGPAPVPLGSIAVYIAMLLVSGFSAFLIRKKRF